MSARFGVSTARTKYAADAAAAYAFPSDEERAAWVAAAPGRRVLPASDPAAKRLARELAKATTR